MFSAAAAYARPVRAVLHAVAGAGAYWSFLVNGHPAPYEPFHPCRLLVRAASAERAEAAYRCAAAVLRRNAERN
jgi:hypothetical protein